jgi:hypothetical protein
MSFRQKQTNYLKQDNKAYEEGTLGLTGAEETQMSEKALREAQRAVQQQQREIQRNALAAGGAAASFMGPAAALQRDLATRAAKEGEAAASKASQVSRQLAAERAAQHRKDIDARVARNQQRAATAINSLQSFAALGMQLANTQQFKDFTKATSEKMKARAARKAADRDFERSARAAQAKAKAQGYELTDDAKGNLALREGAEVGDTAVGQTLAPSEKPGMFDEKIAPSEKPGTFTGPKTEGSEAEPEKKEKAGVGEVADAVGQALAPSKKPEAEEGPETGGPAPTTAEDTVKAIESVGEREAPDKGKQALDVAGGIASRAATGASLGSMASPIGTAIGAAAGTVVGVGEQIGKAVGRGKKGKALDKFYQEAKLAKIDPQIFYDASTEQQDAMARKMGLTVNELKQRLSQMR